MKRIFGDKYSIFILKKERKDTNIFPHEKGDTMYGSFGNITNINGIVTIRDLQGQIYYTGKNHVDCIYRRFNIRTFIRRKYFELFDYRLARQGLIKIYLKTEPLGKVLKIFLNFLLEKFLRLFVKFT
jgi:hypothetical protein